MEPTTSLSEGKMARLASGSKITVKQSLRTVGSSLIYPMMPPTNWELYEAAVGLLNADRIY